MDRLRICRQIRNYVQHHDDGKVFLTATPKMCSFLEALVQKEAVRELCAGDLIYRLTPLTDEMKLSEVLERFAKTKRDWLPVTDKDGQYLGSISAVQFCGLLSENKSTVKIKSVLSEKDYKKNPASVLVFEKDSPVAGFENEKIVVVSGEANYLGVVKW